MSEHQARPSAAQWLHQWLAGYSETLGGALAAGGEPRRLTAVGRELHLPAAAGARGGLDYLFVDEDALPLLVEAKRANFWDSRSAARLAVGQILEYAARLKTLPAGFLRTHWEKANPPGEVGHAALLERQLGVSDYEAFWQRAEANLASGKTRLLLASQHIPAELEQTVEFLGEFLPLRAVSLPEIDAPTDSETASPVTGTNWRRGLDAIYQWARSEAEIEWHFENKHSNGDPVFAVVFNVRGRRLELLRAGLLENRPHVKFSFANLAAFAPYDNEARREALRSQIEAFDCPLLPDAIHREPLLCLETLAQRGHVKALLALFDEVVAEIS